MSCDRETKTRAGLPSSLLSVCLPLLATGVQLSDQLLGATQVSAQREALQGQEQQGALRLPLQRLPPADPNHKALRVFRHRQSLQPQI